MLINQTIEAMRVLKLTGMVNALEAQLSQTAVQSLSFEDRLGILIDAEASSRSTKKYERLIKNAKLKNPLASIETIDFAPRREIDRQLIMTLANCTWVASNQNIIITGATGAGKTWMACALGSQLCRNGYSVKYFRLSRLLEQINIAKADGSLVRLRSQLLRTDVIILDDWLLAPLNAASARELLELVDDRIGTNSLILASQHPVDEWHNRIGEPTVADAILDRIVHSAHRVIIKGDSSLRKQYGLSSTT